jgi:hypothetical protein
MPPVLVFILVGLLLLYIGYLRLQLHIQQSVQHKIEQLAVVIPAKTETEGKPNYGLALALMLVFFVLLGMAIR